MTINTCSALYCTFDVGQWRLINNKWSNSNANQSIYYDDVNKIVGWTWNGNGNYNYPEIICGTDRGNWGAGTVPNMFPVKVSNITIMKLDITWNYPIKPTAVSGVDGGMFGLDIYFGTGSPYHSLNFMVWIQTWNFVPGNVSQLADMNDGYNTYGHYAGTRQQGTDITPWHCFLLKNQPSTSGTATITIDLKKMIDSIPQINSSWSVPEIQLGNENNSGSGKVAITSLSANVNGQIASIGTVKPTGCQNPTCTLTAK